MNPMMMGGGMCPGMSGMNPMMMMGNMQSGMNPMMMMAAMQSGMNPMMMGMNPMMMAAMQQQQQQQQQQQGSAGAQAADASGLPSSQEPVDSRVRDLCRSYNIDEKTTLKLNTVMHKSDSFDEDMQALAAVMEKGVSLNKKPIDILLVKIREIERGTFCGKDLLDPDIREFADKYDLDDR